VPVELASGGDNAGSLTLIGTLGGVVITALFGLLTAYSRSDGSIAAPSRSTVSRSTETSIPHDATPMSATSSRPNGSSIRP
jgi:hypothetical protein